MEDYLITTGLQDAVLKLASGDERAGVDLHDLVEQARVIRNVLSGIHSRYNRKVVEQAAILGVLNAAIFGDPEKASAAAPYIARRLDVLESETERGWEGKFVDGEGFLFERTVRGVKEVAVDRPRAAQFGRCAQARRVCRRRCRPPTSSRAICAARAKRFPPRSTAR